MGSLLVVPVVNHRVSIEKAAYFFRESSILPSLVVRPTVLALTIPLYLKELRLAKLPGSELNWTPFLLTRKLLESLTRSH